MPEESQKKKHRGEDAKQGPKERKEIPLVSVPSDDDAIAKDMADLFEEDQVTHKHGSAEPEGD